MLRVGGQPGPATGGRLKYMSDPARVLIGESFAGDGAEAAHINTVLCYRAAEGKPDLAAVMAAAAKPASSYYSPR